MITFLVDLILLRADKGAFVYVWVNFDVRVVAQLEGILGWSALGQRGVGGVENRASDLAGS